MVAPSRAEVLQVIDSLLSGEMSREAASVWACRHLSEFFDFEDSVVDDALSTLAIIDGLEFGDDGQSWYLFDFAEISAIRELL